MKPLSLICLTGVFFAGGIFTPFETIVSAKARTLYTSVAKTPVVFDQMELVSAESEQKRLKTIRLITDFSATGLYVPPLATIRVLAEQEAGSRLPTLIIGTYCRYGTTDDIAPQLVPLKPGMNEISSPLGGLIWIRYTNDHPDSKARLSFISGFKRAPYYIAGTTTHKQWKDMLSRMTALPDVVLQGERCMIVVSRAAAIQYQDEDQELLLNRISTTIKIEDGLSGLDGSTELDKPNAHQRYLLVQHEKKTHILFYH